MSSQQPIDRDKLLRLKKEAKKRFGRIKGVEGFGLGDNCLRIYITNASVKEHMPTHLEGVPIEFVITGEIKPLSILA
jgi:hypothetical protein